MNNRKRGGASLVNGNLYIMTVFLNLDKYNKIKSMSLKVISAYNMKMNMLKETKPIYREHT